MEGGGASKYTATIEYLDQNTVHGTLVDVLRLLLRRRKKMHIATSIVNSPSEHMPINSS
jgi:hypothetical protein